MAVKMFDKDLSRREMVKSLEDAMCLAGVLETVLTSDSSDLEANREGMRLIVVDVCENIAHVLESLKDEDGKAAGSGD